STPFPPILGAVGENQRGEAVVSVLQRRTYGIGSTGSCRTAEVQLPLDTRGSEADREGGWASELDVLPYKIRTDVVVFGNAHPTSRGQTTGEVTIQLGSVAKRIRVFGRRQCVSRGQR